MTIYGQDGRGVIRLGDRTDHGGEVISVARTFMDMGKPVACVGDLVQCPKCKGIFPIVQGDSHKTHMGLPMAFHGDKTACGASLISSWGVAGPTVSAQSIVAASASSSVAQAAASAAAAAPPVESFHFVDRKSPEIMQAIAEAPVYKKQGRVKGRPAKAGEEIVTTLESGARETVNRAKEGDWIVTNPGGEQYILSEKRFFDRNEATDEEGVYAAKGYCRAIVNPLGKPIQIMASWGSPQMGDGRCLLADTCDASGKCDGEPYIIEADAFATTYKEVAAAPAAAAAPPVESFHFVDRKSPEIMQAIAEAPVYKKQGRVKGRPAKAGEEIVTTLESGARETVNIAKEGDWIVTNPGGEQYILSEKRFFDRNEATDEEGVYAAKGYCRAIVNPLGKPIQIMASWGSPQMGDGRCLLADTCDASGKCDGEPYIIEADAFATTYKEVAAAPAAAAAPPVESLHYVKRKSPESIIDPGGEQYTPPAKKAKGAAAASSRIVQVAAPAAIAAPPAESFHFVDRKSPEIMQAIAKAPVYKKQGKVKGRPAKAGEEIVTTLESGARETVNRAKEGDWIVTNPGGEQYILPEKRFFDRNEATDEEGVYAAKGYCRAIVNPLGKPIQIMASWGSPQMGDGRCLLADTCDASGKCDGEPYIIEADAFATTYKKVAG